MQTSRASSGSRREAAGCYGDPGVFWSQDISKDAQKGLRAKHMYIQLKLVRLIIKGQPEGRERIPGRKREIPIVLLTSLVSGFH